MMRDIITACVGVALIAVAMFLCLVAGVLHATEGPADAEPAVYAAFAFAAAGVALLAVRP